MYKVLAGANAHQNLCKWTNKRRKKFFIFWQGSKVRRQVCLHRTAAAVLLRIVAKNIQPAHSFCHKFWKQQLIQSLFSGMCVTPTCTAYHKSLSVRSWVLPENVWFLLYKLCRSFTRVPCVQMQKLQQISESELIFQVRFVHRWQEGLYWVNTTIC